MSTDHGHLSPEDDILNRGALSAEHDKKSRIDALVALRRLRIVCTRKRTPDDFVPVLYHAGHTRGAPD